MDKAPGRGSSSPNPMLEDRVAMVNARFIISLWGALFALPSTVWAAATTPTPITSPSGGEAVEHYVLELIGTSTRLGPINRNMLARYRGAVVNARKLQIEVARSNCRRLDETRRRFLRQALVNVGLKHGETQVIITFVGPATPVLPGAVFSVVITPDDQSSATARAMVDPNQPSMLSDSSAKPEIVRDTELRVEGVSVIAHSDNPQAPHAASPTQVLIGDSGDEKITYRVAATAVAERVKNYSRKDVNGGRVVTAESIREAQLSTVLNDGGIVRARQIVMRNGVLVLSGGEPWTAPARDETRGFKGSVAVVDQPSM